ncbi:hypothetical protein [uncultured Desulfobacter sp.]|uniref:hypothetical protein n=1 Tax=uncultured Desulfobacter sp. TaxID=240139 RepID=UPI002AAB6B3A|nr:hypothetical protein [uncultured Desulfobacter sp.]
MAKPILKRQIDMSGTPMPGLMLKLGYERDSFDIYLYADNLFDKEYDSREEYMVFYSQPREIGVQLNPDNKKFITLWR